MLTLKEMRFKGIGPFVDEQRISFVEFGNLIQVDGKNNNTGGSSAAAKSTIFHALDFLFGINKIPNSILQSRFTEEPMEVEATFDYDGLPLTITRGKKLKIDFNGEITTGSSKISEEKLDQILSIPRALFKPMLHKEQGERGFFLSFTPKQTNDFLTDCLGLSGFKAPLLAADAKILDLNIKKGNVTNFIGTTQASLNTCKSVLSSLGEPPVKEVDQDTVRTFQANLNAAKQELDAILARQKTDLMNLEMIKPVRKDINFDRSVRVGLESKLQDLAQKRNSILLLQKDIESKAQANIQALKHLKAELTHKIDMGNGAESEAMRLADKVKKVREAKCHTCGQDWANDKAKLEEQWLLENISKLKAMIVTGKQAESKLVSIENELEIASKRQPPTVMDSTEYQYCLEQEKEFKSLLDKAIKDEQAHSDLVNTENYNNQTYYNEQLRVVREKHSSEQAEIRSQIESNSRSLEAAVLRLKSYEEARVRYENTLQKVKLQEQEYTDQFDKASQELTKINYDIECYEELKKAIKSYLSCSFDEALETIGENATRLVRHIPNMANATIQLTGVWETKDGKIKEEVNAIINLAGDENVDIRSLCGGERSAIDLAVDLSVIELIENKTNKGINVLILDEPFTGLDSACIEMALEVLKNASTNKKLIIVDHNPIIKEFINRDLIMVERTGLTSRIA